MEIELLSKKSKGKNKQTKQSENIPLKEEKIEIMKKEGSLFQIPGFQQYNTLMKLRIVVITIFSLCTISMILVFAGGWEISAVLLLISYLMLFILMLKLFRVKKL